jgi:serine/threonine-protein kinase
MGEVYRARDLRLRRDVAIKIMPPELAADPGRLARFEREARMASALNHPNIVTIHAIDEHAGRPYIAMELVEGKTFRRILEDGPVPAATFLPLLIQVAEGLAKAHAAGIVHRDLKPENLMITDDGLVKILDFGLAKLVLGGDDSGSNLTTVAHPTREGTLLGTVQYMSPEQALGRALDHRTDQFSFGSILYEMATGKPAFQRDSMPQTLTAIIEDEPEPMSRVAEHVPGELTMLLERCLEKEASERYESTDELVRELHRVPAEASGDPRRADATTGGATVESIAVLPFRNLSGDPTQEFLADGVTEALIIDLAKIGALKVISRTSVMRYKGTDKPLPKIGRELGVDGIVEGSVARVGDRIRVTAQLLHAPTDRHLWAESYERDFKDLLVLQSEAAQAVAAEIQVALTAEEAQRLLPAREVNPEAHEAYLRGTFHRFQFTPADLDKALEFFDLALQKDPDYALAYVGISHVWSHRLVLGVVPPREAGPKWEVAASKAIELDDTLASAHEGLAGFRCWHEYDWDGAEPEFQRAIELNPNDGQARVSYGHFLAAVRGREKEARDQLERALELDPLNSFYQGFYAVYLVMYGHYDEAIAQCRLALQTSPNFYLARHCLWFSFKEMGRLDDAFREVKALHASFGDRDMEDALTQGHAEGGYPGAMQRAADSLAARSRQMFVRPFQIAHYYDEAGQTDLAFEWLEKAYEARDHDMAYLRVLPLSDRLRTDPRFHDMLERMNLPPRDAGAR